jgi:hypothetical protein
VTDPLPFAKRSVHAAVVIDSRNVRGQICDTFGVGREVSVAATVDMFAGFGFEVDDVYVAIGTDGMGKRPSRRLEESLARNKAYAEKVVADARGHVLQGRLVERPGRDGLEEKLVDVLCAIQVARLAHEIKDGDRQGVVIVWSEDMDLIPAYEFARDLGVAVFAASNGRVNERANHSRWLLLPESSLLLAGGRPRGRYQGSELRRQIARLVTAEQSPRLRFKAFAKAADGSVLLQHNTGARAVWTSAPAHVSAGQAYELYITDLQFREGPFPWLVVDHASPQWPCPAVVEGTVTAWRTPTRLAVDLAGGVSKTLDAPAGTVLPGHRVLVHAERRGSQEAWGYVGPLDNHPGSPGWSNGPASPVIVRAVSSAGSAGALVRARILATGQEVTLQPPGEDKVATGWEYAALPAAHTATPDGTHVSAVAISSRLR